MQQQQFERFARGPQFEPEATPDFTPSMKENNLVIKQSYRAQQRAVQDNYQTTIDNQKRAADGIEKLAVFSETVAQQLVERQEELNEKAQLEGLRNAYVNGVPADIQEEFNKSMQALDSSAASTERMLNDAVDNNAITWKLSRELSSMSPHTRVGYAKGILQQLGQGYPQQLQTELLDALAQNPGMSVEEKAQRLQDYRYNWMKTSGLGEFNPALLNEELFPKMKEAEAAIVNQWRIEAENEQRQILGEDADMLMQQPNSQANWETASELYRAAGYTRSEARKQALSNVQDLATLNDWAELISFDGKTPLGVKYEKDFNNQRVALLNAEEAKNNYDDRSLALGARNYAQQFIDAWDNGEPVREEDLEEVKRRSQLNYGGVYDPRLDRYDQITQEKIDRDALKEEIERLQAAGVDTSVLLNDPNIPWTIKKELIAEEQSGSSSSGGYNASKDPYAKQLEKDIIRNVGSDSPAIDTATNTPGVELAQTAAVNMYAQERARLLRGSDISIADAEAQAYQYVLDAIKQGKDNSGDLIGGTGVFRFVQGKGYVTLVRGGGPEAQQQRNYNAAMARKQIRQIDQLFSSNGDRPRDPLIDQVQMITTETLQTAVERSGEVGYTPPQSAVYISKEYFGGRVSPWEILQRQAKVFLGEDIMLPSSLMREQQQSPTIKRLLNRYPSYNRISRGYRRMSSQGFDSSLIPNHYGTMVTQAAQANNIDPAVLSGLLEQESGWNNNAVSRAGAQGLGQFMPATAREFGVNVRDPQSSIDGAARYLRYLIDYFGGDLRLAVYAYNGGMGNIEKYGGPIPGSTENEEYYDLVMERATRYGYRGYVPGLNPAIQQ